MPLSTWTLERLLTQREADGLDEQAGRWTEKSLNSRAQRVVINGTKSVWRQ